MHSVGTQRRMDESTPVIDVIVTQHAEEASFLWSQRHAATRSAQSALSDLARHDDRLAAHVDGLRVAADAGVKACYAQFKSGERGAMFAAALLALESQQPRTIESLFSMAEAMPALQNGFTSAFGWVSAQFLQGTVKALVEAIPPFRRLAGVACCAMHRVDPGLVSGRRIQDASPVVRARALRTAGEIGSEEAAAACRAALRDDDPDCRFWAAWSSVLLGDRGAALEVLNRASFEDGRYQSRSLSLALQAMKVDAAHSALQELARRTEKLRWLIEGSGVAGDPMYVPWLIKHMTDQKTARLAAGAFALITGVDMQKRQLEGNHPENVEAGPNDRPEDPNVDMDPDDGLPWPDAPKIEKWWAANEGRFQKGTRYFMGAPVTREHCIDVLKNGYQRQRILAAHYLCLLEPGTPLFNTSAPAWRQQRLLAKMT